MLREGNPASCLCPFPTSSLAVFPLVATWHCVALEKKILLVLSGRGEVYAVGVGWLEAGSGSRVPEPPARVQAPTVPAPACQDQEGGLPPRVH